MSYGTTSVILWANNMETDLKNTLEALKREIDLLKELVRAKDDLIHQLKFRNYNSISTENVPVTIPFISQQVPFPQPPFIITCDGVVPDGTVGGTININGIIKAN